MSTVDLPIPVVVTRHQCPHCRRTHSKKAAAVAHIARCWKNPANRSCKSCALYEPAVWGEPCFPGRWCDCNTEAEHCLAGIALEPNAMPVTSCPKWEPQP